MARFLFNSAKTGNVTAQIFWLKTRARWRETPTELRHSGALGSYDLHEMSDTELQRQSLRAWPPSWDFSPGSAGLRDRRNGAGGPTPTMDAVPD